MSTVLDFPWSWARLQLAENLDGCIALWATLKFVFNRFGPCSLSKCRNFEGMLTTHELQDRKQKFRNKSKRFIRLESELCLVIATSCYFKTF